MTIEGLHPTAVADHRGLSDTSLAQCPPKDLGYLSADLPPLLFLL